MERQKLTKKGKFFDYSLLIIVLFLVAFGLVMVYSTSSYSAMQKFGDSAYYFKKQLIATAIGLVCLLAATFINYHFWYKIAPWLWILAIVCVFLVIPFGVTINNARRWINVFNLTSVQPAEILKLALIIFLAAFCAKFGTHMQKIQHRLIYWGITIISAGTILFITSNLSSAVILVGIAYVILLVANPKPKLQLILTGIGIVILVVGLLIFFKTVSMDASLSFRFRRILAWRDPEAYVSDIGYQTLQALYAIGSGGFWGKGLGASMQKLGFIPEAQNDMIFSVVCEELGLFGGICLIILFLLMLYRFIMIANNAPDSFGGLLVTGVLAHIAIQVVLNIAVVTNVIPNTGITLPFISYGGTSVMFLLIEMGIVLNVSIQIQVQDRTGLRTGETLRYERAQ